MSKKKTSRKKAPRINWTKVIVTLIRQLGRTLVVVAPLMFWGISGAE
jgi:hypothetical protein